MKKCIGYVLGEGKSDALYEYVDGPYAYDEITADNVYKAFIEEKKLWNKDSGRMSSHYVLSFHCDEKISAEEVFEFAKEFYGEIFSGYQFLMAVHLDKDHLHAHAVINTVSYMDGSKLHISAKDLDMQKKLCNEMCAKRGLTVAKKGYHFDGSKMAEGEVISWRKDDYNMLRYNANKSLKAKCMVDVKHALNQSISRDDFIHKMKERGWIVKWSDKGKYIVFEEKSGFKIRSTTLGKSLNMNLDKEAMENEFRINRSELVAESGATPTNCNGYAETDDWNVQSRIGEQSFEGAAGAVIGSIQETVRSIARAVSPNGGETGRGDSTDPGVVRRSKERKLSPGERDEEEHQGFYMHY